MKQHPQARKKDGHKGGARLWSLKVPELSGHVGRDQLGWGIL